MGAAVFRRHVEANRAAFRGAVPQMKARKLPGVKSLLNATVAWSGEMNAATVSAAVSVSCRGPIAQPVRAADS